ncbi:MAG: bifunctional hydroxymethylpyrimidine kinase/phosphomethylpyrimidine kinase [Muribaculaceae bacterium]|nr:bifunctional hydroxymethylpyrimidine kinase/phosphomethylpyrimidine kinase [Muribaculaceae bacterium]
MKSYIPVLSIAGSDSSGGAGIQADIKTISALGCYGMTAITAITAQNTLGVTAIQGIAPDIVGKQIDAVYSDIPPLAVKTGMLYNAEIVEVVSQKLNDHKATNLVIDPVMVSTSGSLLIAEDAIEVMKRSLFPLATLVTPNAMEARHLTGCDDLHRQALCLRDMGCRNILLKGGHSERTDLKIDYLLTEGSSDLIELRADAVESRNTHGTGCTLSSAIASYLAMGFGMEEACSRAKLYLTRALKSGASIRIGHGHGPVNHLFGPRHMKYITTYENNHQQ